MSGYGGNIKEPLHEQGVELRLGPDDMAAARDEIDVARDLE